MEQLYFIIIYNNSQDFKKDSHGKALKQTFLLNFLENLIKADKRNMFL